MEARPNLEAFAPAFEAGRAQVVSTSLVADLETPVSAMLKLANGRPFSFLLESVTGGAVRGRYSILGVKPDLIWRCRGGAAEINRSARFDPGAFMPCVLPALDSLRQLIAESRVDLPDGLPLMAAGLFGYMAYDMVRLVERLPDANPDRLGSAGAVFLRATVVAAFAARRVPAAHRGSCVPPHGGSDHDLHAGLAEPDPFRPPGLRPSLRAAG